MLVMLVAQIDSTTDVIVPFVFLAIVVVSVYSFLKLYAENRSLKSEEALLADWRDRIKNLPDHALTRELEALSTSAETAISGHIVWQRLNQQKSVRDQLVRQAILAVWMGRGTGVDREAISTMLAQREAGRLSFPLVAPNLLMLCGLIGTVLGLSATIPELSEQVRHATSNADPAQLGESLGATLSKMQLAFWATLAGVASALTVGFFTRHVSHRQNEFLADVQEFMVSELGPRVLPQQKEATIEDLSKALKDVKTVIKQVPAIMESAAETFSGALGSASDYMQQTLTGLSDVATSVRSSLESAASDVRTGAQNLAKATDAVATASDGLRMYHADLTSSHKEMLELFDQSQAKLELQITSQLSSIDDFRQDVMRSAERIVSGVSDATTAFNTAGQAYHGASEEGVRRVIEFREAVATRFQDLQQGFEQVLSDHQSELGRVGSELRQLAGKFDPVLMSQEWERMLQSIDGLRSTVGELRQSIAGLNVERLAQVSRDQSESVQISNNARGGTNEAEFASSDGRLLLQELRRAATEIRQSAEQLSAASIGSLSRSPERTVIMGQGSTDSPNNNGRLKGLLTRVGKVIRWPRSRR